jgi:hypothetical protein
MRPNTRRGFGLSAAVIAAVSLTPFPDFAQSITVGPNRMVSASLPGWEHSEYVADADPSDPKRVMVCSMRFSQSENRLTTGIYTSFDGGEKWVLSHVDSSSRFGIVGDPACAYGVNGDAFLVTLSLRDTTPSDHKDGVAYADWSMGGGSEEMHVFRSPNGGRSWLPPVKMGMVDREQLQVDRGKDSPFRGRMYLHGRVGTIWVIYSDDSGRTWKRSDETTVADGGLMLRWSDTILPDGTYLLPFGISHVAKGITPQTSVLAVAASTDGGKHFGLPIPVRGLPTGCAEAALASDHSTGVFRGRLYLAWGEMYRNRCALFIVYSDDKGRNWSSPIRATAPRPAPAGQYEAVTIPQIAVNGRGVVGIAWYDWGMQVVKREARLYFTASLDGGDTWLPSVLVSAHPFTIKNPPEFAARAVSRGGGRRRDEGRTDTVDVSVSPSPVAYYPWNSAPGDYAGMAGGADGVFHTFWIGNRTGVGELYTARVTVSGTVGRVRDGELANLENLTSAIEFQYTSSVWNSKTRTISLEYRMLNTSRDTIRRPLKLRIVRLESDLGVPTLLLGQTSTGETATILDLSRALPASGLAPGQATLPQAMRVKLDDVVDVLDWNQRDIVHLNMQVYATVAGGHPYTVNGGTVIVSVPGRSR